MRNSIVLSIAALLLILSTNTTHAQKAEKSGPRLYVNLFLQPNYNLFQEESFISKQGLAYGAGIGLKFSPRFSIQTGASYLKARGNDDTGADDATFLEIPLDVRFRFGKKARKLAPYFIAGGTAAFAMENEPVIGGDGVLPQGLSFDQAYANLGTGLEFNLTKNIQIHSEARFKVNPTALGGDYSIQNIGSNAQAGIKVGLQFTF